MRVDYLRRLEPWYRTLDLPLLPLKERERAKLRRRLRFVLLDEFSTREEVGTPSSNERFEMTKPAY